MPSSPMHTSTARNLVESCRIRTSDLLSRARCMSKPSRIYLGDLPRRCTTAPSNHDCTYSVTWSLFRHALRFSILNVKNSLPKIEISHFPRLYISPVFFIDPA
ncbi:Bgt-20591 [Blumeria graminis f. sp. tritici]|uniref:Bgt-20591 n=2 Tax=Blumeria graminis f. sp. tritici TaxID=62690 RepID=A0A9X9MJ19_BLUGR|nr:Bgt-20591 [Blumeria graminis f. sp. tritici]